MTKQQIEGGAAQIMVSANNSTDKVQQFCIIWQGTIRPTLELVKKFTGPKIDRQIDELERAADNVCAGTNPDVANYCAIWHASNMESILKMVMVFVGPKAKKAINFFIDLSDDLCGE